MANKSSDKDTTYFVVHNESPAALRYFLGPVADDAIIVIKRTSDGNERQYEYLSFKEPEMDIQAITEDESAISSDDERIANDLTATISNTTTTPINAGTVAAVRNMSIRRSNIFDAKKDNDKIPELQWNDAGKFPEFMMNTWGKEKGFEITNIDNFSIAFPGQDIKERRRGVKVNLEKPEESYIDPMAIVDTRISRRAAFTVLGVAGLAYAYTGLKMMADEAKTAGSRVLGGILGAIGVGAAAAGILTAVSPKQSAKVEDAIREKVSRHDVHVI